MPVSLAAVARPAARLTLGLILGVAGLAGCEKDPPATDKTAAKATADKAPVARKVVPPAADLEATSITMVVHPTIGSKCRVIAPKAFFAFDSAKLGWADNAVVDELVKCLSRDDMAGEKLRVIGRASVAGSTAYNRDLAKRRAQAVVDALVAGGIDRSRLEIVARGEKGFDAPGTAPGRALQRRVDLQLADRSPEVIEVMWWDIDADQRMNRGEFYTHVADMLTIDGFDSDESGGLSERETAAYLLGAWDADSDGVLSLEEWNRAAPAWFPKGSKAGEFATWDGNTDGRLEGQEWVTAFMDSDLYETWDADEDSVIYDHELAAAVFAVFDLNGDGWLDTGEAGNVRAWRPAVADNNAPPPTAK